MPTTYSKSAIQNVRKSPAPRVLLNVCTHGSERVGLKIAKYFSHLTTRKGSLIINIANERALAKRKRFIASDLNRVFPGKKNGTYEEKLAYRMTPFVRAFDFVIDVHSTETGMKSTVIVTKFDPKMIPLLKHIAPRRVVCMSATKSNALISVAKQGIAFEYGKDKDPQTCKATVQGITRTLEYLGMVPVHSPMKNIRKHRPPEFFEAYATLPKPKGFIVRKGIQNFKLLPKSALIARNPLTKKEVRAKHSFYPVLFGNNSYATIFGFVAKKKSL